MASDLSSGCTEAIGVLDEKEEGEISLEDVSSSEEGHLNYGYGVRVPQCPHCSSTQHCTAWCPAPTKIYHSRSHSKREVDLIVQDAVHGKENRHQIKESGYTGTKHTASTLQEKNDDLVPISSDSDMEIVGLADNSKQIRIRSSSKGRTKKKRKKKRSHASVLTMDDLVSTVDDDVLPETVSGLKHNDVMAKSSSLSRSHHRDVSPVRRNNRSRLCPRTPPRRHRSPIRARSPFKKSRSPVMRIRSPPVVRKSPRRAKSPKVSSFIPSGHVPRKVSHVELSPNSQTYMETNKLLKKVRQLDSMGTHSLEVTLNKHKEHASSLKEKLTTMMKGVSDNNGNVTNYKEKPSAAAIELSDADDEDDLALLRQKALETKQKGLNKRIDQPKIEVTKTLTPNPNDDEDEEDLELRMIALRSAVMKKHQNRIEKGMKSGKYKKSTASRSESPFTQSFLDSIPIPGEELLNFASPPHTPPLMNESNHTEDMELDTDVEREKEKLPYSPTDKITSNIPMDTELLGIQPSDVSFISLNEANNSPVFSTATIKDDQKSLQEKIIENRSYLPNVMYYPSSQSTFDTTNSNLPYSPTDSIGSSRPDTLKKHNSHIPMHHYMDAGNMLKDNAVHDFPEINSSQEMPYSPTDTPMYDPDLSLMLPQTPGPIATSNSPLLSLASLYDCNMHGNLEQFDHVSGKSQAQIVRESSNISDDKQSEKGETYSIDAAVGSATTSIVASASPASSLITIDDLPDTDADGSPSTEFSQGTRSLEYIPHSLSDNVKEIASEPLYMKGIPHVTKDVNKIPTLINRTLVPAPILKSNKQLQQPLLARKPEVHHPEATFKSAEMQPVAINEEATARTNTLFKPMKLVPIVQKSHSIVATPTVFHDSSINDSLSEATMNKNTSSLENKDNSMTWVQNTKVMNIESTEKPCDNTTAAQKKKKSVKKGARRKNVSTTMNKSNGISSITKDNTAECSRVKKNDKKTDSKKNVSNEMNDSTECNMKSSTPNTEEKNVKETLSADVAEKKNIENRRQSLDEDEEALRAILLASLPKRAKVADNTASISTGSIPSAVSNATSIQNNQVLPNQTIQKPVETFNATVSCGTPPLARQPTNSDLPESNKQQPASETNAGTGVANRDLSNRQIETTVPPVSGRKRPIPIVKGPQKKIMKKNTIPASTKVVNNAKKYQNAIVQKRLNLQKVAMLYTNQKITENKTAANMQLNKNKWSTNTKPSLLSDTQRIVINLESDTESDSESDQHKNKSAISSTITKTEKPPAPVNSKAEFEKNLDQFLRHVRKQQESVAAGRPTVSIQQTEKINPANVHTPLAVRHLPASQQEEYRRLKQQILEREKLNLRKTIENNTSPKTKPVGLSPKSVPSAQVKSNCSQKELQIKGNQTTLPRNPTVSTQQLNKENKNLDSTKNPATLNGSKTSIVNKPGTANAFQMKTIPKTMTNLSIRLSNENIVPPNSAKNRILGTPLSAVNTTRTVFENITPTQEALPKTRTSSGLKILSKDEVNRKYVQIQVKQDTNERVVTINDKVNIEEKLTADVVEKTIEENSTDVTDSSDINNFLQTMEKEIIGNNTEPVNTEIVDSDASTIVLPRENQNTSRRGSLDSNESTILLSQYLKEKDNINSVLTFDNKSSIEENWEPIKRDTKTELSALISLPEEEQERHLIETEQKLVTKRYAVLDELTEMSGSLCQWHMERDLQTNLAAEVRKLREQLKIAEERLQLQRDRINSIEPKVVAAHGRINAGRQECFKLSRICSVLGTKIIGNQYKVPEAGAQILDSKLKEVANHTRRLSRKKVPSIDISEVYISSKSDQRCTDSATCSKSTSVEKNLSLEGSIVDDNDTTIATEVERTADSNQSETTIQVESVPSNSTQLSEEGNVISNDLPIHDNELSISEQQNQTITSKQPESSSTPIATNDFHEPEHERLSENERPSTFTESIKETRNLLRINTKLQTKRTVTPYVSILTHFKVPRNTNPNGVLCPYELMGTCNDGDCQFVHQSMSEAK